MNEVTLMWRHNGGFKCHIISHILHDIDIKKYQYIPIRGMLNLDNINDDITEWLKMNLQYKYVVWFGITHTHTHIYIYIYIRINFTHAVRIGVKTFKSFVNRSTKLGDL